MLQDGQQSAMMAIAKPHAHIIMTQMNVREGIRKFGKKGNEALLKELNQLHQQEALLPIRQSDMSHEEKKKALWYIPERKTSWKHQSKRMH